MHDSTTSVANMRKTVTIAYKNHRTDHSVSATDPTITITPYEVPQDQGLRYTVYTIDCADLCFLALLSSRCAPTTASKTTLTTSWLLYKVFYSHFSSLSLHSRAFSQKICCQSIQVPLLTGYCEIAVSTIITAATDFTVLFRAFSKCFKCFCPFFLLLCCYCL
jgi:hypothetical protein